MKRRHYFKTPSQEFIERSTDEEYRRERPGIIHRTKFIYKLFGPPRSTLFGGVMTADAYHEMITSYIFRNYLSVIFVTHTFIESSLGFRFIMNFGADEKIAEAGLAKMLNVAYDRGWISRELRNQIDELRRMRIAYFHTHVGMNERGAMKRYLTQKEFGYKQHRRDAEKALRIAHDYLREDSPESFPHSKRTSTSRKSQQK
jgi:hypothetical protein